MTGFLQRLAASVRPAAPRILPVVEPLHSGAGRFENEAAPVELDVESAGAASPPDAAEPGMAREAAQAHSALVPREADRQIDVAPRAAPRPPSDVGAPLRAHPIAETSATPATKPSAGREAQTLRTNVGAETTAAAAVDGPLVQPLKLRVEAPRARIEPWPRAANERAIASQPHEVHINIGRVEVIAASPPPPRAAPESKATSLEDYLRGAAARRR